MVLLTTDTAFYVFQKLPQLSELPNYLSRPFRLEVLVAAIISWLILRQITKVITPSQCSKVLVLLHAFIMLAASIQTLCYMCSKSFAYADMYLCMNQYERELAVTTGFAGYVSLSYFIHDSFYIHGAYIKHHVAGSFVFFVGFYLTEVSLLHCVAGIGFFEFGAILVQLSRAFPKILTLRTLICIGYAASRITAVWYYGYIFYQAYVDWDSFNINQQLLYVPAILSIIFLLVLNFRWTFLQWQSLLKAYHARFVKQQESESFFEYHQQILGNVPVKQN